MADLLLAGSSSYARVPSSAASAVDGVSARTYCYVSPAGTLMPDHSLSAFITQTFKKYLEDGGYAWRLISEETKDTYWEEFNQYYWDEGLDDEIYKKWFAKAANRYNDFVHNSKRRRHTEGRPPHVPEQVWASWCAYWDTDAAQELSQKVKKNRLSEPDGEGTGQIKHRGGSRSAAAHAVALETGGDVGSTTYATFRRCHFKDGQYTYTKSQRIGDEVERRYTLACQPLSDGTLPPPVDINQIYLEVCGGLNKKNRIFGIGSLYTSHASSPTASNLFSTGTSSQQHQDELKAQLEAERVEMEARLKVVEDKYCQNNDDLWAQTDALKEFMTRGPRPS